MKLRKKAGEAYSFYSARIAFSIFQVGATVSQFCTSHVFLIFVCVCVCACVYMLSHVQFFAILWTVAHQAPLSMGFSRQEYWKWSRLSFPTPVFNICCCCC